MIGVGEGMKRSKCFNICFNFSTYLLLHWTCFIGASLAKHDVFPLMMPKVFPSQAEDYLCTPIRMDEDDQFYITGFQPNASMHTAHHILIYGCEEPGSFEPVWRCGEMAMSTGMSDEIRSPCKSKPQIIYAWAKDAPKLKLPEGVAFRVGVDSDMKYLVLQVHYASIDHIPSTGDDSGVLLEFTDEKQPRVAGVMLLGTGGLAPPHSTTFFETSCPIEDDREVHPIAYRVHTHALGRVVSGWRVRNNSEWTLLGKQNPQRPQMFYPVDNEKNTLGSGDVVAARCTMVNTRDRTTFIGTTKDDEMCNFYLMYWVDHGKPLTPNSCFSHGPPLWSWGGWELGAGLRNIPDEEASTL